VILAIYRFFQGFEVNPLVCLILIAGAGWLGLWVLKATFGPPVTWLGLASRFVVLISWVIASVGAWNWARWNFAADRAYPMFALACALVFMGYFLWVGAAIAFSVFMVLVVDPIGWLLAKRKKAAK
jgi:xanthine/uracil permease